MSDANPKLTLEQANDILEQAFPKQGVSIKIPSGPSGAYKVLAADGKVLGSAFDLLRATRQACEPIFKAEKLKRAEEDRAKLQDFKDFMQFMRERFTDEFDEWRDARAEATEAAAGLAPDAVVGTELGETRLVSLVP